MKHVGVDLHKKTISVCVVMVEHGKRKIVQRKRLACADVAAIEEYFASLAPFEVVVEATACYEWFVAKVEPLASRVALAHPKKLRVIAESARKSDKIDAEALAVFLAMDMMPQAWRPTPRVRQWRTLVRQRQWIQGRITCLKCKLRHKLAWHNADLAGLFSKAGQEHLAGMPMGTSDRFVVRQLQEQMEVCERHLAEVDAKLRAFAADAPQAEREAREALASIPQIGPVTIDVVLSELGDFHRFRSQKQAASYAGLAPGFRSSAEKRHDLHITKEGSRLLRWALIEAAWRLVGHSPRWRCVFDRIERGTGSKKAIVAVARKLLCMMVSMLQSGSRYRYAG